MAKKNQVVKEVEVIEATTAVIEATENVETVETVETTEVTAEAPKVIVLVNPGKQGVTNTQLIPAIKAAIEANDLELMANMINAFPEVYTKSYKYFQKKYKNVLDANGFSK